MSRETAKMVQELRARKRGVLITPRPGRTQTCVKWTLRQELWPWVERYNQLEATPTSSRVLDT